MIERVATPRIRRLVVPLAFTAALVGVTAGGFALELPGTVVGVLGAAVVLSYLQFGAELESVD